MVCLVGGLLAYIFRTQVVSTIQAEMIADIRSYDPATPEAPVTRAWDLTQERLQCCGLMTEKVTQSWQMWRFNRNLNPGDGDSLVVPRSCCVTDQVRLLYTDQWPDIKWGISGLREPGQPDHRGEGVAGGLQGAQPQLRAGQGQDDGRGGIFHERIYGK